MFQLYGYLTWLQGWVIEALDQDLTSEDADG
jgi:hypothetical protein